MSELALFVLTKIAALRKGKTDSGAPRTPTPRPPEGPGWVNNPDGSKTPITPIVPPGSKPPTSGERPVPPGTTYDPSKPTPPGMKPPGVPVPPPGTTRFSDRLGGSSGSSGSSESSGSKGSGSGVTVPNPNPTTPGMKPPK